MIDEVNENIIFFIIALVGYLYYRYNSPNQIIDRYYKKHSETEYYLLKYTILILPVSSSHNTLFGKFLIRGKLYFFTITLKV